MISAEAAVDTLIEQANVNSNGYRITRSYVVMTSEYKTAYTSVANEFELDRELANKTNPAFKLDSIGPAVNS